MLNFLVRRSLRPYYSNIAGKIYVAGDWLEFSCVKPARPRRCMQHISLIIPGYRFDHLQEDFEIRLQDGRVVRPMIEVVDAIGNKFETEDGNRVGNLIGFHVIQHDGMSTSLSDNLQKVVVRIRSDEPFECESIDWVTKRLK